MLFACSFLVPSSGCLQLDPTPPPVEPTVRFNMVVPPEMFNFYPRSHSVRTSVLTAAGAYAPRACYSTETYNKTTGAREWRSLDVLEILCTLGRACVRRLLALRVCVAVWASGVWVLVVQ